MQLNLELGVVVSLLPLVDSLNNEQVLHNYIVLFCFALFVNSQIPTYYDVFKKKLNSH